MKASKSRHRGVCILCGKPSKARICEPCSAKVRGEALNHKMQAEKRGK